MTFNLDRPWSVLFGASGSGKTTILRVISGLLSPRKGVVSLGGRTLLDTAARIAVEPYRRTIRCASQSARLFPHLTIEENIRYGIDEDDADAPLIASLRDLFRIAPLLHKVPAELSGGEQQRVSVARAVASAASITGALLLLDEPFNGLDLALRDTLAQDLKEWLSRRQLPVLSVTHDVGEAFLLDAEVLRLQEGRIVEQGAARQVLAGERERILKQLGRQPGERD